MTSSTAKCDLPRKARDSLEKAYADRIRVNSDLDRSLVSFQRNKEEPFYRWFKYKEGFSSRLVQYLLATVEKAGVVLDPFAGAGAALFASRDMGWNAIGIELLPVGVFAMEARLAAEEIDKRMFAKAVAQAEGVDFARHFADGETFTHLGITQGAFPDDTEREILGFLAYCDRRIRDRNVRRLFRFACFSELEDVSYTRKDGQYLRWDARSSRRRGARPFDKGIIAPFHHAVISKLRAIEHDIDGGNRSSILFAQDKVKRGTLDVRRGSCLRILPTIADSSVDLVITSPPYCNRYDYTRTYALELAFLGYDDREVKALRQEMLSCTVENREKVGELREYYGGLGLGMRFREIEEVFQSQEALWEVLESLGHYRALGMLNNNNIPRMVRNYFYEMCFVTCELARLLRAGGSIFMVNDNVRYAGEAVPVDLILSEFAKAFGLDVGVIWTLPRGKGNSSQQMGAYGRDEIRKCVYAWSKPYAKQGKEGR